MDCRPGRACRRRRIGRHLPDRRRNPMADRDAPRRCRRRQGICRSPTFQFKAALVGGFVLLRISWVAVWTLRSGGACGASRTCGACWTCWTGCADRVYRASHARIAFVTLLPFAPAGPGGPAGPSKHPPSASAATIATIVGIFFHAHSLHRRVQQVWRFTSSDIIRPMNEFVDRGLG
jgi:hypothetical protein